MVPVVISTSCPVLLEWHLAGEQVAPDHAQGLIGVFMIYVKSRYKKERKMSRKKE
jgi:hypothetical protein